MITEGLRCGRTLLPPTQNSPAQKPWLTACSELASLALEDCAVMSLLDTERACTQRKDGDIVQPFIS